MLKTPKTFIVGVTQPDMQGILDYLMYTNQREFYDEMVEYQLENNGCPLCLVSLYAKLCYKSLVAGKNANVTRVRDIEANIRATIDSKHGSVFEHVWVNFLTTDCSRVFTHELVRHRAGTAFSQTSGRYVAIDQIDLVLPPEMTEDPRVCDVIDRLGDEIHNGLAELRKLLIKPDASFDDKKRITSAIRRLAPNGQTNEIGWSVNVRALRHILNMRLSDHAEWEIRTVAEEVRQLVAARWPRMLLGDELRI